MEGTKKYSSRSCTPVRKLRDKCESLQEALLCACKSIAEKDTTSAESNKGFSNQLDNVNISSSSPRSRESNMASHLQDSASCETPKSQKSPKVIVCMYKNSSKSIQEAKLTHNERRLNIQTFCNLDRIPPISSTDSSIHQEAKLEDLQLELKHLIERIEGPMQRQLCKQQVLSADLEKQLALASSKKSTSYKKEIEFLKQQLAITNRNISDLGNINQGLKDEIRILNFKCDQLQKLIVNHQINEANN